MLIGLQFIVQQTYTTVFKYIKKLKVNLKDLGKNVLKFKEFKNKKLKFF